MIQARGEQSRTLTGAPMAPAWQEAARFGCDMSLLEETLRKSPAERIRLHARARQSILALRAAVERSHA